MTKLHKTIECKICDYCNSYIPLTMLKKLDNGNYICWDTVSCIQNKTSNLFVQLINMLEENYQLEDIYKFVEQNKEFHLFQKFLYLIKSIKP